VTCEEGKTQAATKRPAHILMPAKNKSMHRGGQIHDKYGRHMRRLFPHQIPIFRLQSQLPANIF